jgi:hypothetical protein
MSELVDRYVHQVGRYLPEKDRAEIMAELRSQIADQLDDRYEGAPTQADVAAVLTELGDPRRLAASYAGERYLIGPDLYPTMMMVLRRGWVLVPPIVVLVHVLAALVSQEPSNLLDLVIEAAVGAVQATLLFTAVVVLIFAIVQHSGEDLDELTGQEKGFDPLALPEVDDPAAVDRFESAFSITFGTLATLVLLYFLRVGGLTLRFNLSDPGDVIPVSIPWLMVVIITTVMVVGLNLLALLRNRWSVATWLTQMALELVGAVGLYYAVWIPLFDYFMTAVPSLADESFMQRVPELIFIASVVITLVSDGGKLVKMLSRRNQDAPAYRVKPNGG